MLPASGGGASAAAARMGRGGGGVGVNYFWDLQPFAPSGRVKSGPPAPARVAGRHNTTAFELGGGGQ